MGGESTYTPRGSNRDYLQVQRSEAERLFPVMVYFIQAGYLSYLFIIACLSVISIQNLSILPRRAHGVYTFTPNMSTKHTNKACCRHNWPLFFNKKKNSSTHKVNFTHICTQHGRFLLFLVYTRFIFRPTHEVTWETVALPAPTRDNMRDSYLNLNPLRGCWLRLHTQ